MKKILLLGGSRQQIPAIKCAKEKGYYTILCDYLQDNPGQYIADKFYLESTTDKEVILNIAKREKIDGIVAYASDPAAPTAAYVAEKLGLPTNPYKAVKILSNKDLFRKFLKENNFNCPNMIEAISYEELREKIQKLKFPVIIKPVDSSGSKGITKLVNEENLKFYYEKALKFSREKKVIVEEIIEGLGFPLAGDGFSVNGKLVFYAFADDHFDYSASNSLAPVAETYPYIQSKTLQNKIVNEIQRVFDLLNIKTGAYNFEVRIDKEENVYLMEIGPRNGGNGIPPITRYATGIDMIEYTIKAAMGESCDDLIMKDVEGYWSTYMVHSNKAGKLKEIVIDEEYKKNNLIEFECTYNIGDKIPKFDGSNGSLGTMLSKYSSYPEMMEKIYNFSKYVKIILEEDDEI